VRPLPATFEPVLEVPKRRKWKPEIKKPAAAAAVVVDVATPVAAAVAAPVKVVEAAPVAVDIAKEQPKKKEQPKTDEKPKKEAKEETPKKAKKKEKSAKHTREITPAPAVQRQPSPVPRHPTPPPPAAPVLSTISAVSQDELYAKSRTGEPAPAFGLHPMRAVRVVAEAQLAPSFGAFLSGPAAAAEATGAAAGVFVAGPADKAVAVKDDDDATVGSKRAASPVGEAKPHRKRSAKERPTTVSETKPDGTGSDADLDLASLPPAARAQALLRKQVCARFYLMLTASDAWRG
jgi:hypothetical protein